MPFLYMKVNTIQESVKIKSTTLLLIVENIKSENLLIVLRMHWVERTYN